MYVHIVVLLLQLIHILWVFYVSNLSICHKFTDSSIYGGLIPFNLFYCLQVINHKRVGPMGINVHWFNPQQFILAVCKVIIPRESYKGSRSTIELIPSHFLNCLQCNNIRRVFTRSTKDLWVNHQQLLFTVLK